MKTVIFGGTTEGREISRQLAEMGADVTVSVVSEYGARQLGVDNGMKVVTGSRTCEEMTELIADTDLVIDATHPFALEASANIAEACERAGVRRIRLIRGSEEDGGYDHRSDDDNILRVRNREEAARLASEISATSENDLEADRGNVLLTTGVRDLSFYCEKLGISGTYARVLPSKESIEACLVSGLEPKNIIAMQGPFSVGMNEALIREFNIDVIITKESGRAGGFAEKLRACENCRIKAIVISRPEEEGKTYEEALEECKKLMTEE